MAGPPATSPDGRDERTPLDGATAGVERALAAESSDDQHGAGEPRSTTERPSDDSSQAIARRVLEGNEAGLRWGRRLLRRLPASPRCKLCASPFTGPGGFVMRHMGKPPWPKNPKYCSACFSQLQKHHDGAEIACSLVFADVRGSTSLAERLGPTAFRELMNRFFVAGSNALIEQDGIVDKYVGDEIIGLFIPVLTGGSHAGHAIEGARALVAAAATLEVPAEAPATSGERADVVLGLPVGAGVHSGIAYVGAVGAGENVEMTAMGDPVNVTARLASAAGAGEILVTLEAARLAGLVLDGLEQRHLELRGKSQATDVVVLRPAALAGAPG